MYGRSIFSCPSPAPFLVLALLSGCAMLEPPPPPPRFGQVTYDGPIWCYRTLAQPECYAEEQPQFASRLIGSYVELPPPPAPSIFAPRPSPNP